MNQIKYGTCAKCRIILNSLFPTKGPLREMNNYIKRKRAIVCAGDIRCLGNDCSHWISVEYWMCNVVTSLNFFPWVIEYTNKMYTFGFWEISRITFFQYNLYPKEPTSKLIWICWLNYEQVVCGRDAFLYTISCVWICAFA